MCAHVTATVRVCFAVLQQIRSVRRSVTHDALLTLLRSLVITKLDFGGSALIGVWIADATASVCAERRHSTSVLG